MKINLTLIWLCFLICNNQKNKINLKKWVNSMNVETEIQGTQSCRSCNASVFFRRDRQVLPGLGFWRVGYLCRTPAVCSAVRLFLGELPSAPCPHRPRLGWTPLHTLHGGHMNTRYTLQYDANLNLFLFITSHIAIAVLNSVIAHLADIVQAYFLWWISYSHFSNETLFLLTVKCALIGQNSYCWLMVNS